MLKRTLHVAIIPIVLLTAIPSITRGRTEGNEGSAVGATETATRVFEFIYNVTITEFPADTGRLDVWLPYPKSDPHQEILDVRVSSPSTAIYTEPRFGNSILHVGIDRPKPGPVDIRMTFRIQRTENGRRDLFKYKKSARTALDPGVEMYLEPDILVPVTDQIRKWAAEVTRGKKTDLEKVRAIYDYTVATMKYDKSGEGWGRGDIIYACDEKRGNCTDFHAVFIGFTRAVSIPARFAIGFPLPGERGQGEIGGYHCWAEFYLDGHGWVPVDASEAWRNPERKDYFFGGLDENRVQFSIGRDITLRPRQKSGPLNYFIYPHVEADGKPLDTVSREFSFRDLKH